MKCFTKYKMCTECLEWLPVNSAYFHKEALNKDGFRNICKEDENSKRNQRFKERYKNEKEFREKKKEREKKRNEMKKNVLNKHTEAEWEFTLDFFNHECAYCNDYLYYDCFLEENRPSKQDITEDHIIPLKKEGPYIAGNIIPACKSCNSSKKDLEFIFWYKQQCFFSFENLSKIIEYLVIVNERTIKENISA